MSLLKNKTLLILSALVLIGIFLRFYNLPWGAPFYFHPDERNIASAVSQLSFPNQMNPHFFAYGSLPLYFIYCLGLFTNFLFSNYFSPSPYGDIPLTTVSFDQAIIISRIISASFSVLLIPLLFFLGKKLFGNTAGILAAALATFSVGFIQFAHYGTTEMWLTFFSTLFFLSLLEISKKLTKKHFYLLVLYAGILISVKISSLVLLILPLPIFFLACTKQAQNKEPAAIALKVIGIYLFFILQTGIFYLATNPFVLLDTPSFINSMRYESTLATGSLPVFYTQEFISTIPVLFQFTSVYPFLLNPLLTILFPFALIMYLYRLTITKKWTEGLVLGMFFLLFLSQALLFVKWTRYMVPTLPFIYLLFIGSASFLMKKIPLRLPQKTFMYTVGCFMIVSCSIFAFSYFITAFGEQDTRVNSYEYAMMHIPPDAEILSEVYDLGIVPFNSDYTRITLFNFYDLDTESSEATPQQLASLIEKSEYIILPSQRLYKTRLQNNVFFPRGYVFYNDLKEEKGFAKIYETPCDIFCRITYLSNPVFSYEMTASVFDRPTVMIYKKL